MKINAGIKFKGNTFWKRGHWIAQAINRYQWHNNPKKFKVANFPLHVDIELTNTCNLRCNFCFNYKLKNKGFMKFDLFKKIIDECARNKLYSIRLSWRGETTLHPDLITFIKYAKKKGIKDVSFLTNGSKLTRDMSFNLIHSGLDYIGISIDGVDETYEKIRKPIKYREIINNLIDLNLARDFYRRKKPVIDVRSVASAVKSTKHRYFKEVGYWADKVMILDVLDYSNKPKNANPNFICQYPWQRLVIGWDGIVHPCCADTFDKCVVGDATKQSLKRIWHSKQMNYIRYKHKTHKYKDIPACRDCPINYRN